MVPDLGLDECLNLDWHKKPVPQEVQHQAALAPSLSSQKNCMDFENDLHSTWTWSPRAYPGARALWVHAQGSGIKCERLMKSNLLVVPRKKGEYIIKGLHSHSPY